MKKRVFSLLLVLAMAFSLLPMSAFAAESWATGAPKVSVSSDKEAMSVTIEVGAYDAGADKADLIRAYGLAVEYDTALVEPDESKGGLETEDETIGGMASDVKISDNFNYTFNKQADGKTMVYVTDARDKGFGTDGFSFTFFFKAKEGATGTAAFTLNEDLFVINTGDKAVPYSSVGSNSASIDLGGSTPETFTVSFNANGGTGTMAAVPDVSGEYALPACTFTAPAGKVFEKWDLGAVGDKITVTKDTTVTAQWKDAPVVEKYTVSFDANGGTGTMAPVADVSGEFTLPACTFTAPADKVFDKWDLGAVGDKISVTKDTTVTAQWKDAPAVEKYTVSFDANGGTGTMADVPDVSGEFTLPACTFTAPAGKVFDKWDLGAVGDKISVTADITVKAVWKDAPVETDFNIIVAETANGTVTVDKTTAKAKDTVTITVKADTDNGYALGVVTVKDSNNRALAVTTVKVNEEYTFVVPATNAGDITVSANFAKPINITASLTSNGDVTVQKTAVEKQTVIINTDPNTGYRVSSVKVTDTASKATIKNTVLKSNSQYSFVVPEGSGDIKVDVVFARSSSTGGGGGGSTTTNTISVTKNNPTNGTVAVSSSNPVVGNTVTITVTPNTGYKLDKLTATNTYTNKEITLKDSGKDDGKYTFTAPSNNVRVEASFVKIADVTVTVEPATNGTVKANADKVPAGGTITVTATPNEGYVVDTVTAVDSAGKDLKVEVKEGQYLFTAPDKADTVKVTATFKADPNYKPGEPVKPVDNGPFVDVASGDWFNDAVMWANEKGITTGTTATTFSPNEICTRAQAVTFLWRLLGQPAASITSTEFTDIDAGAYYYPAVLWAVENNITVGTSGTTFSPSDTVTRGQLATFLYRLAGAPDIAVENPFGDVASNAYYYFAVLWAFDKGIVTGYPDGTFKPANDITRAEIVTMMYRGYSAIH